MRACVERERPRLKTALAQDKTFVTSRSPHGCRVGWHKLRITCQMDDKKCGAFVTNDATLTVARAAQIAWPSGSQRERKTMPMTLRASSRGRLQVSIWIAVGVFCFVGVGVSERKVSSSRAEESQDVVQRRDSVVADRAFKLSPDGNFLFIGRAVHTTYTVRLYGSDIEGLARKFPDVTRLYVENVFLEADAFGKAGEFRSLKEITIRDTNISDAHVQALFRLPSLVSVSVVNGMLTDTGANALLQSRKVKHVWLGRNRFVPLSLESEAKRRNKNSSREEKKPVNEPE